MIKEDINDLIKSLNIDEFDNFYHNNSNKVVCEHYQITSTKLNKILTALNIPVKTKEDVSRIIRETLVNKSDDEKADITNRRLNTRANWDDEKREKVSKAISDGATAEVKARRLNSFHNTIRNKSEEQLEIERKHRSDATKAHWESLTDGEKMVFSNKMSDVYNSFSDEKKINRIRKIQSTQAERGIINPFSDASCRDKIKETNLQKYGVPYFCMSPVCRNAAGGNSANSKPNQEFSKLLKDNNIEFTCEFNLDNYSYDFKVGETLIEINPSVTHNSTWSPFGENYIKSNTYHKDKSEKAAQNGYRCICVWDWDDKDKIIQLLRVTEKVYARNCVIKNVDSNTASEFINKYHCQGDARCSIRVGLFYNDELISIMTFGKPRYNKKFDFELIRYCSSKTIVGGAKKLFKYFLDNYSPNSIVSYCDLSKFNGNVYNKLGFVSDSRKVKPSKHWYNIKTKQHITDNLLRQRGFDQLFGTNYGKGTSNEELILDAGFIEIYDCGQSVYKYFNKEIK